MPGERGVVLVEQDRRRRYRLPDLGGVAAIVEPDADDLLRARHARPELHGRLRHVQAVRPLGGYPIQEAAERRGAAGAAMDQIVDGGGRLGLEGGLGAAHVEESAVRLDPERQVGAAANGREGHVPGHLGARPGPAGALARFPGRRREHRRRRRERRATHDAGGSQKASTVLIHGSLRADGRVERPNYDHGSRGCQACPFR